MASTLKSTKAKVRDSEKVREVLESYEWEGVEIHLQEEGSGWTLAMGFHGGDQDWREWPLALRNEELPSEDEYPDLDALLDAESELYSEKGREGFLALLRDLAAHLESPLMILTTASHGFDYGAEVWRVEPGAKDVENLEV